MNWLLHNPIADMPGPRFLLFYAMVIVLTVVGCWLARRSSDPTTTLAPPPVPPNPDPYEVAYLRGGENEVTRVAILSLIQRGYLRATQTPKHLLASAGEEHLAHAPDHPDPRHLTPMERAVFGWFATAHTAGEIFQSTELTSRIQAYCLPYDSHLKSQRLLMPPEASQSAWNIGRTGALVILGLGGYKLALALMKGRTNVAFLILMGLLSLVPLVLVCRTPRISSRGRAYLERLQLAFDRLKGRAASLAQGGVDPNLLLLVGLFGVGVLAGTPYDYYQKMFHKAASSGGSCGGGCGSCGGGGGDGGGGCGGCGGGGD